MNMLLQQVCGLIDLWESGGQVKHRSPKWIKGLQPKPAVCHTNISQSLYLVFCNALHLTFE